MYNNYTKRCISRSALFSGSSGSEWGSKEKQGEAYEQRYRCPTQELVSPGGTRGAAGAEYSRSRADEALSGVWVRGAKPGDVVPNAQEDGGRRPLPDHVGYLKC